MADLFEKPLAVAAVRFKWQKDDKTYDYFIPADLDLKPGDKVVVEIKRGETVVEVVEIKESSDVAEKTILRVSVDETKSGSMPAGDWNF